MSSVKGVYSFIPTIDVIPRMDVSPRIANNFIGFTDKDRSISDVDGNIYQQMNIDSKLMPLANVLEISESMNLYEANFSSSYFDVNDETG